MDPASLYLELGAVVFGLAILARIAAQFTLPAIPLFLLAGLAFGEGGIVPIVTAEEFVEVGASLGVVLLLFMLGLEFSARELLTTLRANAPTGGVDFVLNFTPGFALALILGWGFVPAVVLGGVTYNTSSGIIARVLGDLGWLGNRETPTVLATTVLEDLTNMLYFPLLAALLVGGEAPRVGSSIGIAVLAMILTLFLGLRFGQWFSRMIFSHSDEVLLLTMIGLTLIVAGVAESLQASAAVGAFLLGTVVSGEAADRVRPLLRPVRDLFAAVFFFFFGLEIDPQVIPQVAAVAVALAIFTSGTKMATGWWGARRIGAGPWARLRAGVLLIPRAEFSIIIAELAMFVGVREELGALATAYVLFLAVLGPLLARTVHHFARPRGAPRPAGRRS